MLKLLKNLALGGLVGLCATTAFAAPEKATAAEAVALVKRAVAFYKANGKEKAIAVFNDPKGEFVQKELYVFVYSMTNEGMQIAHGANPKIVNKYLFELRDGDGKEFIKEMYAIAKTKGSGWVDYKWPNPITKDLDAKTTYIERVDDVFIAAGVYKK